MYSDNYLVPMTCLLKKISQCALHIWFQLFTVQVYTVESYATYSKHTKGLKSRFMFVSFSFCSFCSCWHRFPLRIHYIAIVCTLKEKFRFLRSDRAAQWRGPPFSSPADLSRASCPTTSLRHSASEPRPVAAILVREINFNLRARRIKKTEYLA